MDEAFKEGRENPMEKQKRFRGPRGLQQRFLVGMALILLLFSVMISVIIYFWGKRELEEDAFRRTGLVMAAMDATRGYVHDELRPQMFDLLGEDGFLLEAMSTSFVSRAVAERFRESLPDFIYRRVARGALNPSFEANAFELKMIAYFEANREEQEWKGVVVNGGQPSYMRFKPVLYLESCLRCHGRPEDAPQTIRDRYSEKGFRHRAESVAGVASVAIPIDTSLLRVKERAFSVFGGAFLFIILLYCVVCFFFHQTVTHNLRDLLALFRENLRDREGGQIYVRSQTTDEISELAEAARSMATYIRKTQDQLQSYAAGLEKKVAERTRELQFSEKLLQQKVRTRNRELHTLNAIAEMVSGAESVADILARVLREALGVVPARGAGIYLLERQGDDLVLELQCGENATGLAATHRFPDSTCGLPREKELLTFPSSLQEAACGQMSFLASEEEGIDSLSVPLCCRHQVHGVMTFVGVDFMEIDGEVQALLMSIGQQTGIAIESLKSIMKVTQSREVLQSVFDGITDLVALMDGEGRFQMVNRGFLERFQVSQEEVAGRRCEEFAFAGDCPFTACRKKKFVPGRPHAETVHLTDGSFFEANFYPSFDAGGTLVRIVCYGKDVTEEWQAAKRIQQAEKLVAIGQLAAGVAHEINNPLGVILCYADLLESDLPEEGTAREDVAVIKKHADACRRIVSDLLKFARSGDTVKKNGSINLAVENVVRMMERQLASRNILLEAHLAATVPHMFLDVDKIQQVVLNMVMNAVQAMEADGTISIHTAFRPDNQEVELTVADSGPGIDPEIMDKIFEPFFTTKKPGEGTGLGLAVSYGIVREHGGEISVANLSHGGAVFKIVLPAQAAGAKP